MTESRVSKWHFGWREFDWMQTTNGHFCCCLFCLFTVAQFVSASVANVSARAQNSVPCRKMWTYFEIGARIGFCWIWVHRRSGRRNGAKAQPNDYGSSEKIEFRSVSNSIDANFHSHFQFGFDKLKLIPSISFQLQIGLHRIDRSELNARPVWIISLSMG